MSEHRPMESHKINNEILKYADSRYGYALMRDIGDFGEPYIWLLKETLPEIEVSLERETNAYGYDESENDLENFNFYVAKIEKSKSFRPMYLCGEELPDKHLVKMEGLDSLSVRK